MRVPEGYYEVFEENEEEEALELLKPIYGLVQAARQLWKKMIFILAKKMNFKDVRLKLVNEFIEQGEIEVVFVKLADNDADIFTKNTSGDIHEKLTAKFQSK